jgi:aryl-alcohol dehydrogenase-like predicted oxidoreductase
VNNAHLILGTAQIEPSYGATRETIASDQNWKAIFAEAWACSFTALDTAALYPQAHTTIGQSGWEGEVHTKLASLGSLTHDFALAKRDLKRKAIDLVYFHRVPRNSAEIIETRRLAIALKAEGTRFVGLSVYHPAELQPALEIEEITHVQVPLSALDHRFLGENISRLKSHGKTVIVRSVFLQGLLASQAPLESFTEVPRELLKCVNRFRSEAASRNLSPLQFALGFVRGIADIDGVIIGCETIAQVRESSAAWEESKSLEIDQDALTKLKVLDEALIDPRSW